MPDGIAIAGPIATIIASITAGGIAIWLGRSQVAAATYQAKTANDKLVLDLFDRRLEIYTKAREAISVAVRTGTSTTELQFQYLRAIDGAKFLFGPEVYEYLETLHKILLDLEYARDDIDHASDKATAARRRTKAFEKITDFYDKAPDLMAPYLSAHHKFSAPT